jgi:hypothetical protein
MNHILPVTLDSNKTISGGFYLSGLSKCTLHWSFRELIHVIAPALDDSMVSSVRTIRIRILKLFESQTLVIKGKLAEARSKVHISFDS